MIESDWSVKSCTWPLIVCWVSILEEYCDPWVRAAALQALVSADFSLCYTSECSQTVLMATRPILGGRIKQDEGSYIIILRITLLTPPLTSPHHSPHTLTSHHHFYQPLTSQNHTTMTYVSTPHIPTFMCTHPHISVRVTFLTLHQYDISMTSFDISQGLGLGLG